MTLPAMDGEDRPATPMGLAGRGPYRYARWDGSQRLPDLSAQDVLDALSDDLMSEGDLGEALRRLLERGMRVPPGARGDDLPGLHDLLERLEQRRRELLQRYQLGDVLAEVREELEAIVATERRGIERRLAEGASGSSGDEALRAMLSEMTARRQADLDALPADAGERIRALRDYDFLEPSARERFDALVDRLGSQVLDSWFEGLSEAIRGATPEQLTANREMVRDLDRLLRERLDGREPDQDRVDTFLSRHGGFFPGARTLDDIVEQLAERMAAMQSLLASMSPEQRQELQSMMDALLRDDRLRWDLAQLASTLDQLLPDGLGQRQRFSGREPMTLEGALERLAQIGRLDRMADRLADASETGRLAEVDPDEIRQLLDSESARDLAALQQLARRLEDAGLAERRGDRLELTPRGARQVGQRVLDELFARLRRDVFGAHAIDRTGLGGEPEETAVPYEFGRPFHLDLQRTLGNALVREENAPEARGLSGSRSRRITIEPGDFAVRETRELTSAATVLLVDMSRSMLLRGCFMAAKKVAIALDTLIRTRYPRDELHVVGFAYHAREIRPGSLASLSWHGYEYGTNLQHGLLLARRLLVRSHAVNREIVVITDGEPTAHFEDGQVEFSYPPTRRTIRETLKEVGRCTREGITINTFMLERSRALAEFVDHMTRLNRGRAFYATPERLGEYVLVDFVGKRSRR
ncbi:MAG: VWA domain-containing protein [Chloroflexi bacterium]|nr:VWA domain-containing protein [Chloroflexota bacterium]